MDGWIDGQSLCRLCLCRSECFIDIFGDNLDLGFNVENTIQELLQFQVTRVEGIPSLACSTCIKELNHFRIFKSRCVDSKVTFERRLSMRQREAEIVGRNEDTVSSVAYGNGISTAGDSSKDGGCNVDHGDEGDNGIARVKVEEKAIPDKDDSMPLCIVKVESVAANDKLGIFDKGALSSEGSVFGGGAWGVDGGGNGGESGLRGTEKEEQGVHNGVVVKTESLDEDELALCDDNTQGAISSEGNVFGGGAWGAEVGGNGGESGLRGTEEDEQGVHNAVVVKTESLDEDELPSCDDNSQELSTSEGDVDRDGDDAMDEGWTASAQGDETAAWAAQQGGSVSGEEGETSLVVVKTESLAECAVDEPKSLGSVPSTRRKTNTTAGRFNQKGSKYTERLKRIVVQYAESTSTLQASEHFDIPGRTVRRWKLQSLKWKKALLGKSGPAG